MKKSLFSIFSFFLILLYIDSIGQCANQSFSWNYDSGPNHKGQVLINSADGGFAYGAYMDGVDDNILLTKVSSLGDVQWSKSIGTANQDEFGDNILVLELADGGFIVSGFQGSFTQRNLIVLRLDSSGNVLWSKRLDGDGIGETCADIIAVNASEFIIVGSVNSFGAGSSDGFILKMNVDGSVIVSKTLGLVSNQHLYSIFRLPSGNFICTGESSNDGWIIEITEDCTVIQSAVLNAISYTYFMDCQVYNNEIYCTGKMGSRAVLVKLDLNFQLGYAMTYDMDNLVGSSINIVNDQIFIYAITGFSFANTNSPLILSTDLEGNLLNSVELSSGDWHLGLIRSQNSIISGDYLLVLSWGQEGTNDITFIDFLNFCLEGECLNSIDVTQQTYNGQTNLRAHQEELFTGFFDINLTSNDINVVKGIECPLECPLDFIANIPEVACTNELLELNLENFQSNDYSISWLIDGVEVGTSPEINYTFDEVGSSVIEVQVIDNQFFCELSQSNQILITEIEEIDDLNDIYECEFPIAVPNSLSEYVVSNDEGQEIVNEFILPGTYTVTNSNLCGSSSSTIIVDLFNQTWPQLPQEYYYCEIGEEFILDYQQYDLEINGTPFNQPYALINSGEYILHFTDENGCVEMFDININDQYLGVDYFADLPTQLQICEVPSSLPQNSLDLVWQEENGAFVNQIISEQLYSTNVTNECGVFDHFLQVELIEPNWPSVDEIYYLCENEETIELTGEGNWSYQSGNIVSPNQIILNYPTVYELDFETDLGCDTSFTVELIRVELIDLEDEICESDVNSFISDLYSSDGTWTYDLNSDGSWAFNIGTNTLSFANVCGIHEFSLIVLPEVLCGCYAYVPNSFSPNSDGNNDVWAPVFSQVPQEAQLQIFNRYGQLIFETFDPNNMQWLGEYLEEGEHYSQNEVYTWKLNYLCFNESEKVEKSGFVVLIR